MIDAFLLELPLYYTIPGILIVAFILGYNGVPNWLWAIFALVVTAGFCSHVIALVVVALLFLPFIIPPIRAALITKPIMSILKKMGMLPAISDTERQAIDAGTVWVEKEFFTGKPDFKKIMAQSYPKLSDEERKFVDETCSELCEKVDDWSAWCDGDINDDAWKFIKDNRFFGMIIPKDYGGLKFSALANSYICGKLSAHSNPLGVTVMVPNSLGPAELLLHYGTDEQKEFYLPRLADGREIPCFALTEPTAGSDAGAITAHGTVYKHENGELYMRLNFKKRYITLAAISTVMGLAFKLDDPDNLLGKGKHLGITCALIPSDTPGVRLGRRHDPLGSPFYNCPINGENVELPIEKHVIGGSAGVGKGWAMLMNCLSAGRGISLPATSTGLSKLAVRGIGSYAQVRKQFGISIGKFEGIEEPMAEIGGYAYLMEATRIYTCGGVDAGEKPSVVSAICKYHFTELGREIVNHAMDIAGGSAISRGPKNLFANSYIATPIAITVEGANILTRTMIIFGQGLIRCHPFAQDEVNAIENNDLKAFDKALWKHVGFIFRNHFRAIGLTLTRGWLSPQGCCGPMSKYYRKINWASSVFALISDMAMGYYGGSLKRKEKITGRLGDMLSWMYMASCVIKRFEHEGRKKEHEDFAYWALDRSMEKMNEAFLGILQNFDMPVLGWLLKKPISALFRLSPFGTGPDDRRGHKIAKALMTPGKVRDEMTDGLHIGKDPSNNQLAFLEEAFMLDIKAEPAIEKIKKAIRKKELPKAAPPSILDEAVQKGVVSKDEADLVLKAYEKCIEAIQVDAFEVEDYKANRHPKPVA